MRVSVPARVGLLSLTLFFGGCKEGTIGPELTGSVSGLVLDHETNEPLPGTSITTSPPTDAIVSDDNGQFLMEDVESGNYTIHARKPGYADASVTVRVRENRTTDATIFLAASDDEEEPEPEISAEVTNWWNSTSGDSTIVNVEFRVRNTGPQDIASYEIYFRIVSGTDLFYHEESGSELHADQVNVRQFEKYIPAAAADTVAIDDFWIE